jgi:zinc transporter ZupT
LNTGFPDPFNVALVLDRATVDARAGLRLSMLTVIGDPLVAVLCVSLTVTEPATPLVVLHVRAATTVVVCVSEFA